jgi:hypothetical protein
LSYSSVAEYQQAEASDFKHFHLKVDCEFRDVDDQLKGIEAYLVIDQCWVADNVRIAMGDALLLKDISRH